LFRKRGFTPRRDRDKMKEATISVEGSEKPLEGGVTSTDPGSRFLKKKYLEGKNSTKREGGFRLLSEEGYEKRQHVYYPREDFSKAWA